MNSIIVHNAKLRHLITLIIVRDSEFFNRNGHEGVPCI